jgi:hypothetical protein
LRTAQRKSISRSLSRRTPRATEQCAGAAAAACCALLLLAVSGCEDFNWPYHRASASTSALPADSSGAADNAAECANIQAQIKDSEETRREAPTTSTDTDIVSAAQGKADKRIDDLRQRYDAMDCPTESSPGRSSRQAPLQPAPGGQVNQ